jgi:hypothetical protein
MDRPENPDALGITAPISHYGIVISLKFGQFFLLMGRFFYS